MHLKTANYSSSTINENAVAAAATGITVSLRDATAGSVVDVFYVPATQTVGKAYSTPFKQTTAASNWTMDGSSAITTLTHGLVL